MRISRLRSKLNKSKRRAQEAQKSASFLISKLGLSFPDGLCDHLSRTIYLLDKEKSCANMLPKRKDGLEKLVRFFFALLNVEDEMEHFSKKLSTLESKRKFYPEAKIKIARSIYPGASMEICGLSESVDCEQEGAVYYVEEGEVKIKPI